LLLNDKSHAFLFSGNDEKAKNQAIEFLMSRFLEKNWRHSPDFFKVASDPITIDDVRALKIRASQSPVAGLYNVFLIESIENLSRDAAPALLKLLEEPSQRCVIIATTANARAVLPTIKSRLSTFRFWNKSALEKDYGKDDFGAALQKSLARAEAGARTSPTQDNISKFEKTLEIYKIINDPTANKRLLGEYLNLI